MDPMAISGAFATIVGLLASYKSERSSTELSDFMAWLREKHQEHFAQSIEQNKALSTEFSRLLATNHVELVHRLELLNQQISRLASQIEGFDALTRLLAPDAQLSRQARSVIKQIVESGADSIMEIEQHTGAPTQYIFIGNIAGCVQYDELRFIKEDFDSLVEVGFLQIHIGSKGTRNFIPLRAGVEFVRSNGDA